MCDFSDKIFVGRPDGRFGVVARNSYKLEDVLHRFLKDHREASPGKGLETAREVRFLPAGPDSGVPDGKLQKQCPFLPFPQKQCPFLLCSGV